MAEARGQTARFLHPWIGVVLFVSFCGLFLRMVRLNLPSRDGERPVYVAAEQVAFVEHREAP